MCAQVKLSAIALLLDFKLDESYTPSKIAIRAGTTHADLKEVWLVECLHFTLGGRVINAVRCCALPQLHCCALRTKVITLDGGAGACADADDTAGLVQHPPAAAQPTVSL